MITFGTFDVFHAGHLKILERAKALGEQLIVGVSSDSMNYAKKKKYPIYPQEERMEIISALRCVDYVFEEESLELKAEYIKKYEANILVMGDDWAGKFDMYSDLCDVVYFERTPSISTTELIEKIRV